MNKDLSIIRGDDCAILFKRIDKETKEVIKTVPEKVYFTVKKNCCDDEVVFQKKLDDGISFDSESGVYTVTINRNDTCEMMYFGYSYDIEIISNEKAKTLLIGKLYVKKEVTHTGNEV